MPQRQPSTSYRNVSLTAVTADKSNPRHPQHQQQWQKEQQRQKHDRYNDMTPRRRSISRNDRSNTRSNSRSRRSSPRCTNPSTRQMLQQTNLRDRRDRSRGRTHSNLRQRSRSKSHYQSPSRSRSPWYRRRPRRRSTNNSDGEKKWITEKNPITVERNQRCSSSGGRVGSRRVDSRGRRFPSDTSMGSRHDGNNRNLPLSRNSRSSSRRRRSTFQTSMNHATSHGNKKLVTTRTMTLKKMLRRRNNTKTNMEERSHEKVLKKYLQVDDVDLSKLRNAKRHDFLIGDRNNHNQYLHSDSHSKHCRRPGPSPSTWSSSASASRSFEDPLSLSRSSRSCSHSRNRRSRSRSRSSRNSRSRSNSSRQDGNVRDDYHCHRDDHGHTRKHRPRFSSSATETSTTFLKTDSSYRSYPTSESSSSGGDFSGSSGRCSGSRISGASSVDDHIPNGNGRQCGFQQYPSIYVVNDNNHGGSVSTLYDSVVDSLVGEIHSDGSHGEFPGNTGNSTDDDEDEDEAQAITGLRRSQDISMRELRQIIYAYESGNVGRKGESTESSDATGSSMNVKNTNTDGIVNMFNAQIDIIDNLDNQINALIGAFKREDCKRNQLVGEVATEEKNVVPVQQQLVAQLEEQESGVVYNDDEEGNEEEMTDKVPQEVACNRDQSHEVSTMSSCNGMEGSTSCFQSLTIDQLEQEDRSSNRDHPADDQSISDEDDNISMGESAIFGSPFVEGGSSLGRSDSDDDGNSVISSKSSSFRYYDALRHTSSASGTGRSRYLDESPDDLTRIHRNSRRSKANSSTGKQMKFRLWMGKNKRKNKPRVAKWSKIGVDSVCRMEWTDHEGKAGTYSGSVNHDDVPHGEGAMRMFHNGEIRKGLWINGVLNVGKCDEIYERMAERLTFD
ncbi:hypothetical protein ACHAXS_009163 [Conticribra weissflogii]